MFMEHDDLYQAGGNQHILLGPKLVDPPGECRSNHEVIAGLAQRLGADHPGFAMTARALIDRTLRESGHGNLAELEAARWLDVQPPFRESHYLDGFAHPDRRFRFKPDWGGARGAGLGPFGPWTSLPALPDHCGIIEGATEAYPFRLATSPARQFLNSSFNETPTSRAKEGRPEVMMHPDDAASTGIADGDWVRLRNERGEVLIRARLFAGVRRGVLIAEGLWPNEAFPDGRGINTLTGADAVAPYGGAAFHDNRVALERVGTSLAR
jgi:anaerobic selenocysteine-containing dehydrogenase